MKYGQLKVIGQLGVSKTAQQFMGLFSDLTVVLEQSIDRGQFNRPSIIMRDVGGVEQQVCVFEKRGCCGIAVAVNPKFMKPSHVTKFPMRRVKNSHHRNALFAWRDVFDDVHSQGIGAL